MERLPSSGIFLDRNNAGIGKSPLRSEDERLLRGKGNFSDDLSFPSQAYAVMVRSHLAHARIMSIDKAAALAAPGVLAVLTGADLLEDGLRSIAHHPPTGGGVDIKLVNHDGSAIYVSPHFALPADKTRFVGEPIVMVVAQSVQHAKDAAELVHVDYQSLLAVTGTIAAAEADAPKVWEDASANVCVDAVVGDKAQADAAFTRAKYVVSFKSWIQRVTAVHLEPRAAIGSYDPESGFYTLYAGGGGVVRPRQELANILGVPPEQVRVVSGDVGGNFGPRSAFPPEFALVAWAARRLGRPVKWTCERGDAFLGDFQGRDLAAEAELALDENGRFLAMRGSNLSNVGAHTISFIPLLKGLQSMSSVYQVSAVDFRARAVHSNTPATFPYRSAGRPEAMYIMERLIDLAARESGIDRVELRRRNLIPESAMPFKNPFGIKYDSGAYEQSMDAALLLGDWDGFPARRAEALQRGHFRRGIGVANYIEITGGFPRERAEITVLPEGRIDIVIGTLSSGQGHETSFCQLVTEWLGVPLDKVRLITGDTKRVSAGGGTHSARSMRLAGIVIANAVKVIVDKSSRLAAHVLEAAFEDIELSEGRFVVKGTDRSIGLFELAGIAAIDPNLPEDLRGALEGVGDETVLVPGFPYGCHVCEVEIDIETGVVEIVRYAAVDDVGRAINPMILHGQTHGGIAQGVGQALWEQCVYDPDSGQLLSGSLADYVLPRADNFPFFDTEISEVPSTTHPFGIRGGGEGGTTPALGVVINAIVDALAEFGVKHIEMPATPDRVWRAISPAQS